MIDVHILVNLYRRRIFGDFLKHQKKKLWGKFLIQHFQFRNRWNSDEIFRSIPKFLSLSISSVFDGLTLFCLQWLFQCACVQQAGYIIYLFIPFIPSLSSSHGGLELILEIVLDKSKFRSSRRQCRENPLKNKGAECGGRNPLTFLSYNPGLHFLTCMT